MASADTTLVADGYEITDTEGKSVEDIIKEIPKIY